MTAAIPAPPIDAALFKCTCADWWGHPAVQLLVGDALRPGGTRLTEWMLDRADLAAGSRVLDIGSGTGATLGLLTARGLAAVGLDRGAALAAQASDRSTVVVGDGERLPFANRAFDAVTTECVMSALPDKRAAIGEIHRSLEPGGWLLLSDMTSSSELPGPLAGLAAWVACAAGALDANGYETLLTETGFEIVEATDQSESLVAFVAKARRRLALVEGAVKVGIVPDPDAMLGPELEALRPVGADRSELTVFGREVLGTAIEAVRTGDLGYTALVARRL